MTDFTIKGFSEFEKQLERIDDDIAKKLGKLSINAASKVLIKTMKRKLARHRFTGTLSDSIRLKQAPARRFEFAKMIGVFAPHAHLVEFGTKAHSIAPKVKGGSLSFRSRGRNVVVQSVSHPGAQAYPFIRPTFDTKTNAYFDKLADEVGRRLVAEFRKV